jgi:hypothetical protein
MDIWILLSWKTSLHQRAWAFDACPHCQGLEPIRVEEKVWTFSVWFVPLIKDSRGYIGRCDVCQRPVCVGAPSRSVRLEEWSPQLGLVPLLKRLGYTGKIKLRNAPVDERLRSLLRAAEDATRLNGMDTTFGMTTGAIFGLPVGIGLGLLVAQLNHAKDPFKFGFVGAIAGIVIGLAIGGFLQWFLRRPVLAAKIIGAPVANYKLNLDRLVELSRDCSSSVQQAVLDLRDERDLGGA